MVKNDEFFSSFVHKSLKMDKEMFILLISLIFDPPQFSAYGTNKDK